VQNADIRPPSCATSSRPSVVRYPDHRLVVELVGGVVVGAGGELGRPAGHRLEVRRRRAGRGHRRQHLELRTERLHDLGALRLLAEHWPITPTDLDTLFPEITTLLRIRNGATFAASAETFLDNAGHIGQTAKGLKAARLAGLLIPQR
jgi:hypothetical protein